MPGHGLATEGCACDAGTLIDQLGGRCALSGHDHYMHTKWELTHCNHINTVYALTASTQKHYEYVPNSSHTFIESFQSVTRRCHSQV